MKRLALCALFLTGCAAQPAVPTGSLDSAHRDGDGWICVYLGTEGEGYQTIQRWNACPKFIYQ